MNTATRSSLWENVAQRIRCETGGKVLVVGGRASNFPESLRDHPRIVWWEPAHFSRMRELPHAVRWVVLTRWIDHKTKWRVKSIAPPGVQILDWAVSVKEITNLLRAVEEDPMLKKVTPPVNGHKFEGSLREWLRANVPETTLYDRKTRVQIECETLLPAATAAGFKTDVEGLRNSWYTMRSYALKQKAKREGEIGALKRSLDSKPAEVVQTAPPPSIPVVTHLDLTDPVTPSLCSEFKSAFMLLREQLDSMAQKLERMEAEWHYVMADRARLQVIAKQGVR